MTFPEDTAAVHDFLRVTAVIPYPDGRESREVKVLSRKLCGHGSWNRGGDEKFQASGSEAFVEFFIGVCCMDYWGLEHQDEEIGKKGFAEERVREWISKIKRYLYTIL